MEESMEEGKKTVMRPSGFTAKFQKVVIGNIELFFYRYGKLVGR